MSACTAELMMLAGELGRPGEGARCSRRHKNCPTCQVEPGEKQQGSRGRHGRREQNLVNQVRL